MTKLSNISSYVETSFIAIVSLIALAGIVRFVYLSF